MQEVVLQPAPDGCASVLAAGHGRMRRSAFLDDSDRYPVAQRELHSYFLAGGGRC